MANRIDYTLQDIIECWERKNKNIYQTAKELGISQETVRRKLQFAGVFVPNKALKPKERVCVKNTEVIFGMTADAIREKFCLSQGRKLWILNERNRPVLMQIEKVNPYNITTKNKYGRVECFTYADILTGHCAKYGKEN